ncbi:MAG: hypothetical protein ACP5XB_24585 [Isosphaeraceae bacterium]
MHSMCVLFAYFGPETVMPMTSVVATIAAVVMMFGRTICRFTLGWICTAWYRMRGKNATPAPHFSLGHRREGVVQAGTVVYASEAEQ